MKRGAFLATSSTAALCLLMLVACGTTEEEVQQVEAPQERLSPLPAPEEAPQSRLLITPRSGPAAPAPQPQSTEEEVAASPVLRESATPSPAPPRPLTEERSLAGAAPSLPPAKPAQSGREVQSESISPEGQADAQEPGLAEEAPKPVAEAEQPPSEQEQEGEEGRQEVVELETPEPSSLAPEIPPPGKLALLFEPGEVDLTEEMREQLMEVAQQLREHEEERIQLLAYASGFEEDISRARRLSLARALTIRAFLLDQGIRSTRMDVRALARSEGGPPDRVDIVPQEF